MGNIHFRLGWAIVRNRNNIDQGIEHLKRANELITGNFEIMIKLAGVLFKEKNDTEESLALLEKAIKLNHKNPEAHLIMAKIYDKKTNYPKAIEHFGLVIKYLSELNPN